MTAGAAECAVRELRAARRLAEAAEMTGGLGPYGAADGPDGTTSLGTAVLEAYGDQLAPQVTWLPRLPGGTLRQTSGPSRQPRLQAARAPRGWPKPTASMPDDAADRPDTRLTAPSTQAALINEVSAVGMLPWKAPDSRGGGMQCERGSGSCSPCPWQSS